MHVASLFIILQVFVFIVVVIVLKRILLNDTMNAVARIRQVEAEVRKKEEAIRREIEEHEREFQQKSAEAREKAQRDKEAAERDLAKAREAILADAKRESERIIGDAQINKERMRREIFEEMSNTAMDYTRQIFDLVFSEKIGASINRQFVDELIEALEGMDEAAITVESGEREFVSSHPMDADQKKKLEAVLSQKLGAEIRVAEKVDPKLLAGLLIRIGGLEIDGSLLNRFQEAAEEVKRRRKA